MNFLKKRSLCSVLLDLNGLFTTDKNNEFPLFRQYLSGEIALLLVEPRKFLETNNLNHIMGLRIPTGYFTSMVEDLNSGLPRTNPASYLNSGLPRTNPASYLP